MNLPFEPGTELVITSPEPFGGMLAYRIGCRTTVGALTELITNAARTLIIAAPFMQEGHGLSSGVLADALRSALLRGVDVDVLSTGQGLHTIERSQLMPATGGRLQFFEAASHLSSPQQLGSHAKFCVADKERAYVGSANLTARGMSGQVEMGLLIRGHIAHQIQQFWTYAIELGLIVPIF